jgi:hypothetical protein
MISSMGERGMGGGGGIRKPSCVQVSEDRGRPQEFSLRMRLCFMKGRTPGPAERKALILIL